MSKPKATVLVVDDHPMVRGGLRRLIAQQDDLVCCGEAGTASDTLEAVIRLKPDIVILDLRLRGSDGLELIKSLKAQHPDLRILILSQYEAPIYVERALRAGALGYVIKAHAAEEILKAIHAVLQGEIYLSRDMAALLLRRFVGSGPRPQGEAIDPLTDRELHVLHLLGSGFSTRQIAAELNLSFKTIETHRENIKRKLGLRGAAALIHFATQYSQGQADLPTGPAPQ